MQTFETSFFNIILLQKQETLKILLWGKNDQNDIAILNDIEIESNI